MKTKPPADEEKNTARTYDLVLKYLKGQILEGKLTLGAKLPSERSLMAELGLSRNSVREALRQLENMGFVRSVHGQGSFLVNEAGQGFSSILSMMLLLRQSDGGNFLPCAKVWRRRPMNGQCALHPRSRCWKWNRRCRQWSRRRSRVSWSRLRAGSTGASLRRGKTS